MLDWVASLVAVGSVVAAAIVGYSVARSFVSRRLRFVDAVLSGWAPIVAGVVAFAVAWPIASLAPLVPTFAATVFAIAAALGTSKGARLIRRGEAELRRLNP